MPNKNVLLSSLGLSPAVVTETIDALRNTGLEIHTVVLLSTSNERIIDTYVPLLHADFIDTYQRKIELIPAPITSDDIWTAQDNLDFIKLATTFLNTYRKRGDNVYVSIAGGRKTMSAAMAIVAQLFGAKGLYHVLVPEKIERKRLDYEELKKSPKARHEALHPDVSLMELVSIPVVGLFPYISQITSVLQGESATDQANVVDLLRENELIDADGKPTQTGKDLLTILSEVETAPEASTTLPSEKEIRMPSHNIPKEDREKLQTIADRMCYSPFVNRIVTTDWNSQTNQRYRVNNDHSITFFIPKTRKGLTLRVFITATTRAQSEYVATSLLPCVN